LTGGARAQRRGRVGIAVTALIAAAVVVAGAWWLLRGSGDAGPGTPTARAPALSVLPPISQPGPAPAAAEEAELALVAAFPGRRGAAVVLERTRQDAWEVVGRSTLSATGEATFSAPRSPAGTQYRAVLLGPGGGRAAQTPSVSTEGWRRVFAETFDAALLDRTTWSHRQLGEYNPEGSRTCSKSAESAVDVAGGALRLRVLPDPDRPGRTCRTAEDGKHGWWLNGHISTARSFTFTHGIAAARVRFQRPRGQHGAFWLQPASQERVAGDPARSGAEIDVAEFFGEGYPRGGLAAFVYYLNSAGENEKVGGLQPRATAQLERGDEWWRSYHVFSVEWTAEEYVFRVDEQEIYRTTRGVSGVDQYLILSLLSSDWELPQMGRQGAPGTMRVDWVRVWQD
jgi:beta-glucanase (GH16 family)